MITRYLGLIKKHLRAINKPLKCGLYIHYPFCQSKCPYCHFFSLIWKPELHQAWLEGLKKEIRLVANNLSEFFVIETVYFGGGSPSLLTPEEVSAIVREIRSLFQVELQEMTLEVNPEAEERRIPDWLEAGVSRLSLGVQSFDPQVLRVLGRRSSVETIVRLFQTARRAGACNLNVDLMIGVPGESPATLKTNLGYLKSLHPEHISVYMLEEIDQVPFKKIWEKNSLSEDLIADLYHEYRHELEEAGWQQYEISNFARTGFQCQHNLKYWKYEPFLGLGPSASSHLGPFRWTNSSHFKPWLSALNSSKQTFSEFLRLEPAAEINEALAFGLRLREGVDWLGLKGRQPDFDFSGYEKRINQLVRLGLVRQENFNLVVPEEKQLVLNSIISELIE
ncbi:MAG: radical SAM family heme chaperone HemW [Candidatus Saccharicenans sp.]